MSATTATTATAPRSLGVLARVVRSPADLLLALLAALVVLGVAVSDDFLTTANLSLVAGGMLIPLAVGLGATVALYGGQVDLSVGSATAVSALAFAAVINGGGSTVLAVLGALAAGGTVGLVNGEVTVRTGADALVVTLGTLGAVRGLTHVISGDESKAAFSQPLLDAFGYEVAHVPVAFFVLVAMFAFAWLVMARTRLGHHITATGADSSAADRRGVRTGRIRRGLLVTSGLCAGLAGVVAVGQLAAAPSNLGVGLEFQVFAAVLISGFSITGGGVGNPMTTVLGLLVLALVTDILSLQSVPAEWQDVVTGGLLLGAVALDVLRRRARS